MEAWARRSCLVRRVWSKGSLLVTGSLLTVSLLTASALMRGSLQEGSVPKRVSALNGYFSI